MAPFTQLKWSKQTEEARDKTLPVVALNLSMIGTAFCIPGAEVKSTTSMTKFDIGSTP